MRPIKLILHIGVPKTGSSLIQKSLRKLHGPLRESGIAYVDRHRMTGLPGYWRWTSGTDGSPSGQDFLDAFSGVVEGDLGAGPLLETVLVSNEAISGHDHGFEDPFWPRARGAVTELVETLRPQSTHLILYVRRQDRLLESLYMERIHRGRTIEWDDFRRRVCTDDRVRFTDLIDEVTAAPTVDSIRIRPFEIIGAGAPAFIADFLDGIGMRHLYDHLPPRVLATTNPSYTEPAWRAALALNHLLDTTEQTTRLRRFLRELFPADHYPPAPLLTDQQRTDLIATYRNENHRLFTTHLTDFPPDSYDTPDATDRLRSHLTPLQPPAAGRQPPATSKKDVGAIARVSNALRAMRREWRRSR